MSVFKRNSKWYIKGRMKRDDDTYYNYTKLARGCKLVNEAREYEIEFIKQYQNIQCAKYAKSFESLASEYMSHSLNKEVTIRTDDDIIQKLNKVFGSKKINLFNKEYLQEFIKGLEVTYSKSYVSKYYYTINKIFNYAVDEGYIKLNPMSRVRKSAYKDEIKVEISFWEPAEFNIFIEYVSNEEFKTFFLFLYYMGTRKGEAQAIKWNDVDFKTGTVKLNKTVTNKIKGKAWAITSPKTKNSIRTINMPDIVKEALTTLKQHCSGLYGYNQDCFVFGFDRPLASETIRRNQKRAIKAANKDKHDLKDIRIHDFRHSHVSYLVNNKSDKYSDYEIAQRLGDTVGTIRKTYAHMFKDSDQKIIDFINEDINNVEKTKEASSTDKYNELIELKKLVDMEIITRDDFDKKKKMLLEI